MAVKSVSIRIEEENCPALGIDMHPLGHVLAEDSWDPANAVLLRTLKNHGIWCPEVNVKPPRKG